MSALFFVCPESGREVSTGIEIDNDSFQRVCRPFWRKYGARNAARHITYLMCKPGLSLRSKITAFSHWP